MGPQWRRHFPPLPVRRYLLLERDAFQLVANLPSSTWWQALQQLALPGSHDAGMSTFTGGRGAVACNSVTQSLDIGQQLALGVRYFDLRPVVSKFCLQFTL